MYWKNVMRPTVQTINPLGLVYTFRRDAVTVILSLPWLCQWWRLLDGQKAAELILPVTDGDGVRTCKQS